jgi:inhibitor of Bruton tyrosine kinase
VGVAENGAVIICTQAGAVWRRVRRAKIKDTYISGTGETKNKDYKFQRVPGLTKVAAVRSNTFGGYAALRKDCDITRTQIVVHQQNLWKDLAPLFSLRDFRPPEPPERLEKLCRFWQPTASDSNYDTLKRAVLVSPELETAVQHHVQNRFQNHEEYDIEVFTSLSRASIPVHGFMLSARSPALRDALWAYRNNGDASNTDTFIITGDKKLKIVFHGIDFLTILNLVLYVYTDRVVDVWHFTRYAPTSAFRYRQIRVELMRLAARLGMAKLESAVRLMSEPKCTLNFDLAIAFEDSRFFADADAVVELDGGSLSVHSTLIRQRCSFFEGLFNGRAAGQWLAGRRQIDSEAIKIDMKHIDPSTFKVVLRYIYADVGTELFDDIVSADIDEFCDVVMDVMSAANELMLDRLSQTCQQVIGRFVNTRNICHLLNAVAPCAVTEFKNAGLEYLCLQLEAMLENHLLDDLDEDLLLELDDVVRGNQLACLPFAKSGRAEMLLHERYPSLAGDIDEERQRRARDLTFRSSIRDEDSRLSSSFRTRVGSLDDNVLPSPSQEKSRRKSKMSQNAPFSPAIRPKDSAADLMFSMDD